MGFAELLLLALVGWTALGLVGVGISWGHGERKKAVRHLVWLEGIWVVYVAILVGVSLRSPQRVVAMGQDRCLGEMCFAVVKVDELHPYVGPNREWDGTRLVRVTVRVSNKAKGKMENEGRMQAYLVDAQGRRWEELPGLSGNPLTTRVAAGGAILSEPVFKVAANTTGLELVFTEGSWQPGMLVIGDSDSLWHKRTMVPLGR